jgi:deazaflavin-dependent oxidoreductase (nitroreductase family)
MSDWNRRIIEEFRANEGRVGHRFAESELLLLHHVGAKTGTKRISPLCYQDLDGSWAIFASRGGAPKHPAWYHNLVASPDVEIEVGTETIPVRARVTTGQERERIWEAQKAWSEEMPDRRPQFQDYDVAAAAHGREIPVVVLEPR